MSPSRRTSVVLCGADGFLAAIIAAKALGPQCARIGAELIVVLHDTEAAGDADLLTNLPPETRLVLVIASTSRSEMRARGLAVATGDWVALTETPCIAEPDWLGRLLAPATVELDVIGGSVGNRQYTRASDRAAFLAEYGIYRANLSVTLPGGTPHIAAANVAYARRVLADVIAGFGRDEREPQVHARLHAAARRFHLAPEAKVRSDRISNFSAAWRERTQHGREYGCLRAGAEGPAMRGLRAIAAPVTALLLFWRIARIADRETRRDLWRTVPQTVGLLFAWALGEAMGFVTGRRAA